MVFSLRLILTVYLPLKTHLFFLYPNVKFFPFFKPSCKFCHLLHKLKINHCLMNGSHMFSPFSSAIYHFPPCIFDSVLIYPFSPSEQVLRLMGLIYLSTPRSKCVEWQHRGTKYIFVELDWINRVCAIGREGSCPFKKGLLIIYYFEGQDYRELVLQMATMTSTGPDRSYESESSSRSLIWG